MVDANDHSITADDAEPARGVRLPPPERREQILACAKQLFAEKRYDEVTTSSIAQAAGVTRALVHHYFGSKERLFLEVVREFARAAGAAPIGDPSLPVRKRVDATSDAWLSLVEEYRQAWLATAAVSDALPPELADPIEAARTEYNARVLLHFADVVDDTPLARAGMASFGGLNRIASRLYLSGELTRGEAHAFISQALHDILTRAIPALDGLATHPQAVQASRESQLAVALWDPTSVPS